MERQRVTNTFQDIQQDLRNKKLMAKRRKRRRILKIVFVFFTGILLAFIAFLYDKSDYSKIMQVEVTGNNYVLDQEVIDELGFETGTHFYSFLSSSLEKKVPENSFVESVDVIKHWFNQSMTLDVTEKEIIGYRWNQETDIIELIAQDGSTKGLLEGQLSHLQDLARFTGFDSSESLEQLVDGISRTEPILYSNISEIIREPKTYDENYLRVMMADGVQLYTSIYSLESLDAETFRDIFNRLKEDQKCIVYDVFWRSTFARPCEVVDEIQPENE